MKFEQYSEVEDFQLSISMPRSCGIRSAMIRHELAKKFSLDYSSLNMSLDLKLAFRFNSKLAFGFALDLL